MSEPNNPPTRVRDVMRTGVDVVDGRATVAEALRAVAHPQSKYLLVDKRSDDDEYGMVSYADIARLVLARDRAPERVNLFEIMTKPVIGIDPQMDIRYCARLFERFGLSRAPVMERGAVIGTVSYTDIVLRGMRAEH